MKRRTDSQLYNIERAQEYLAMASELLRGAAEAGLHSRAKALASELNDLRRKEQVMRYFESTEAL